MIGLDIALGFAVSAAQGSLTGQTLATLVGGITSSKLAPGLDSLFSPDQRELRAAVESADLWLSADLDGSILRLAIQTSFGPHPGTTLHQSA